MTSDTAKQNYSIKQLPEMLDPFEQRRSQVLQSLDSQEVDKSRAGGVDARIQSLVQCMNQHADLYTTSSCSGEASPPNSLLNRLTAAFEHSASYTQVWLSYVARCNGNFCSEANGSRLAMCSGQCKSTTEQSQHCIDSSVALLLQHLCSHVAGCG